MEIIASKFVYFSNLDNMSSRLHKNVGKIRKIRATLNKSHATEAQTHGKLTCSKQVLLIQSYNLGVVPICWWFRLWYYFIYLNKRMKGLKENANKNNLFFLCIW